MRFKDSFLGLSFLLASCGSDNVALNFTNSSKETEVLEESMKEFIERVQVSLFAPLEVRNHNVNVYFDFESSVFDRRRAYYNHNEDVIVFNMAWVSKKGSELDLCALVHEIDHTLFFTSENLENYKRVAKKRESCFF